MKRKLITLLGMLVFTAGITAGTSKLSFTLAMEQEVVDNIFQNITSVSDAVTGFGLGLENSWGALSLIAEGEYHYFHENENLSYYSQDLGFDYLWTFSGKTAAYFSLFGKGVFTRAEYRDIQYLGFGFLASLKSYLSQTSVLQATYSLESRRFELNLYDDVIHSLSFSADKYFSSKTTLKFDGDWGFKTFLHPFLEPESGPVFMEAGAGQQGQGQGEHWGRNRFKPSPSSGSGDQSVSVFSLRGTAAQGLGNRIGVRVAVSRQWMISGQSPYGSVDEYFGVENPTSDRFSWEGYQAEAELTAVIPWDIELKIGYTVFDKTFPGIESLDLEGNGLGVIRKDNRKRIGMGLKKSFPGFIIFASFHRVASRSNDPYFDWEGNQFSAGFEWSFSPGR